jgi:hypothetical protein
MHNLTPQSADWIDRAPVKYRATREFTATPEEIWAALCDHEQWPEWFGPLSEVENTSPDQTGVGSTRRVIGAGGRLVIDERFVIWDEPRSWGFTVTQASGPVAKIVSSLNERVELQVLAPDRVRVTYLMGLEPLPRRALLCRLARVGVVRALTQALADLESFVIRNR